MKIEIKSMYTNKIILCGEYESLKKCLEQNREANLRGANLYGKLLTKAPLQIVGLPYDVLITEDHIKVGCQMHIVKEWKKLTPKSVKNMADNATLFAKKYKKIILALHKEHVSKEQL